MEMPQSFFKFVSFDRKDILINGLIRFAPLGSFNDPFELEPTITPIARRFLCHVMKLSQNEREALEFDKTDKEYSSERFNQMAEYKAKYRKEIGEYGVLSLSTNNHINPLLSHCMPGKRDPRTNILMWSHYADSHRGFVIEFSSDFIDGINPKKVEYSEERSYLTFEDIDERNLENLFYKKSKEWSYEQEYRAVLPLNRATSVSNGTYHLFKINKRSIKSITFGCAMSKDNRKIIIDLIKNDRDFCSVNFYHAYLNEEDFLLNFYSDDGCWTNNPDYRIKRFPIQKKI